MRCGSIDGIAVGGMSCWRVQQGERDKIRFATLYFTERATRAASAQAGEKERGRKREREEERGSVCVCVCESERERE